MKVVDTLELEPRSPVSPRPPRLDGPGPALSLAQERLWVLHELDPGGGVHHRCSALQLSGHLDARALECSLNEVVRRHDIVRATFPLFEGRPTVVIKPHGRLSVPFADLGALPPREQQAELARQEEEIARQPFDLVGGPLLRARLLRLGSQEHRLLLTLHALLCDRDSLDILYREMAALYEAFSAGKPSPLPDLSRQYADLARREREWVAGEEAESQLRYWKRQLDGSLPLLELPTDRPREVVQTFTGARHPISLPPALCEALRALCQEEGVPLFAVLLAGFLTLLHRYTRQGDLLVGTPIAHRCTEENQALIGLFTNYLVLRADLSDNPGFRQLVHRVHAVAEEARAHRDLPFERLIEELHLERDRSRAPLFQAMFDLRPAPLGPLSLPGLTLTPLEVESGVTPFDLTLVLSETAGVVSGWFEYSTGLFDAGTVARMAGHYGRLVEGIVVGPGNRLQELPLLTDAERRQVLVSFNATGADYPRDRCIHQLIEEQVRRTPDAVAVCSPDRDLTYAELNARANQLARHLVELGVGPEVRVGVALDRSAPLVVALLAVLKAGGAYVPLDPAYPRDRLAFMLQDSQARVLLTHSALREALPAHAARTLCLDAEEQALAARSTENLSADVRSGHLAYVIYTSGSTGIPKGVAIAHQSGAALLSWARSVFTPEELAGVLASTSVCFDLSVFELFVPLSLGGMVLLAENALSLAGLAGAERVTLVNTVPSAIRELLAIGGVPASVRTINLAGEPLSTALVEQLYRQTGVERVYDLYGPSEDTTYSTFALRRGDAPATIGRPIANTQAYVLDEAGEPVPLGVAGELYLGGSGLARGYLNRPELTAEKFVPDGFSGEEGARLYRTGDLVRYRGDGNLEFLGRIDHQVKVRGFRIELGEIEARLGEHPAVRESVVVAREGAADDKRLVAYVVGENGTASDVGELRRFLKERLPVYMVPGAFMVLEDLPRTPNGKVDRKALPQPDFAEVRSERAFVAPRDALEQQLAEIWEETLGIGPISVTDEFFDLGGHSLLAVRLFARIEETWGKNLPLATLFQAPTIERLGRLLREDGEVPPWSSLVMIQRGDGRSPFFCAHGAGANVLIYSLLARHLPPEQPFYGLQSHGLDGTAPHTCVEEMAAHYLREIRDVQPEGPYYLGGYSFGGVVVLEMARQLQSDGEEVALLAMFNTYFPYGPKYLSDPNPVRSRIYPAVDALERHHQKLLRLGPRGYLRETGSIARQNVAKQIWKAARRVWRRLPAPTGAMDSLPPALRRVWYANLQAEKQYVPRVYPGRITLFWASGDPIVEQYTRSPFGWNEYAAGGLELHVVPGDHTTFKQEPNVRVLAEKLAACLRRAQAARQTSG